MNIAQHLIVCALLASSLAVNAQTTTTTTNEVPTTNSEVPAQGAPEIGDNEAVDAATVEAPTGTSVEGAEAVSSDIDNKTEAQKISPPGSEVPRARPASKSLLKAKTLKKDFNKPLFYDVDNAGLVLPPLELEYDLSSSQGAEIQVGNVKINEKNFYFGLFPLGKTHPQISKVLKAEDSKNLMLLMNWPESVLQQGKIEMISKTGKVLWQHEMTEESRTKWTARLSGYSEDLQRFGIKANAIKNKGIFSLNYALEVGLNQIPLVNQKEQFRFCITQTTDKNSTRLCSQQYRTVTRSGLTIMGKASQEKVSPRVIVNSEEKGLKETIVVGNEMPVSFYAESKLGQSYEFFVKPLPLVLADIVDGGRNGVIRVVGIDNFPVSDYRVIDRHQERDFIKLIGFEATIYDKRVFWMAPVRTPNARIYLRGEGGGVFKQPIQVENLPANAARAYIRTDSPRGTYRDGIRLRGLKPAEAVVKSSENSVKQSATDPTAFDWYFKAKDKGKMNKSYLTVEYEGKEYKSYYELYRGYATELSGRFTGVQSSTDTIVLGEVALNHWFEDLFGWDEYYLSRQRWGLSAKYFQSLVDLTVSSAGEKEQLSVMNFDLKYRFQPGLWSRDESFGAMASYQSVEFGKLQAPMLGIGGFWARSMPKVMDDLFNLVPFMRYPKWVDVEFIYYVNSMDANVELNSSMSLNFHGKVLWSDTIFGEAGFGVKRYGFKDTSLNQKAELNTFYGTVGLGVNF